MSRILTSFLRIASVSNPDNVSLALAAQIFLSVGIVILFIINLIFSMRLVRSTHPAFGWHPGFSISFKVTLGLLGFTILSLIATTIQNAYTLDFHKKMTDRSFQLFGSTILAIVATLPIIMTALACLIPYSPLDEFGSGRFRTKVILLLVSSSLLSLGAWYRCGIAFRTPVLRTEPLPGYLAKGPFYIFNFLIELQTVLMYVILRVDQRWHIPDGAHGPGSYSRPRPILDVEMQNSGPPSLKSEASSSKFAVSEFDDDHSSNLSDSSDDEAFSLHSPLSPHFEKTASIGIAKSPIDIVLCTPFRNPSASAPSLTVPEVTLSRSPSARTSVMSNRLTRVFSRSATTLVTHEQRRHWRASEEARIVRRLGGPWERLPSPTESMFPPTPSSRPAQPLTPQSTDSHRHLLHGTPRSEGSIIQTPPRSVMRSDTVPSIPDIINDGTWTPSIDWDLVSPMRWVSLKKKSMNGVK